MSTRPLWLAVTATAGLLALPLGYALAVGLNPADPPGAPSLPTLEDRDNTDESPEADVTQADVILASPDIVGEARGPGVWDWWDLRGGECLEAVPHTVTEPVRVTFCESPHRARYLLPVVPPGAEGTVFPGAVELEAVAREHCGTLRLEDLGRLHGHDDLVVQPLAPLDPALWEAGPRVMGCVVSRGSGETFRSDLVSPEGSGADETPSP